MAEILEDITEVELPNGLRNQKVEVPALHTAPPSPKHLFMLHNLMAFVGNCGSGKTNAVVLLAREYMDYGAFTRIFVISPTYHSNDVWQALPEIDQHLRDSEEGRVEALLEKQRTTSILGLKKKAPSSESKAPKTKSTTATAATSSAATSTTTEQASDIYMNAFEAQSAINDILRKIKDEADKWQASQVYSAIYRKWRKVRGDETKISPSELNILEYMNYEAPQELVRPVCMLIIDDMSHTDLFQPSRANPFINLCLRHRHIHEVGLTIFICVQNYRTGIPKCLRQNIRTFFIFATKDHSQTDAILDEVGNIVERETFYQLYNRAIEGEDHNFLTIDMFPQAASRPEFRRMLRFRRNFDTFLIPRSGNTITELNAGSHRRGKHSSEMSQSADHDDEEEEKH